MRRRCREQGAVLVIVMMVMLGLLGLGLTALWLTSGNLQVGAAMNQRTQAFYAAEAGIERARRILTNTAYPVNVNNELVGSSNPLDSVPNALDSSGAPNGSGAVMTDPSEPVGSQAMVNIPFPSPAVGRSAGTVDNPTAATMGTYTVWIRNDTAECRKAALGGPTDPLWTTDGNGAVTIRSRGLASDLRTTVVLEASLGATPGSAGSPSGGTNVQVVCDAGKNSCDDNNSVAWGIIAQ